MKKVLKTIIFLMGVIILLNGCCNDKESSIEIENEEQDNLESISQNITYNNGGYVVEYNGNKYYREYDEAALERAALYGDYSIQYGSMSKMKKISDGKIETLFEDYGCNNFYICDDKFFMSDSQKSYVTDMNGNALKEFENANFSAIYEEKHLILLTKQEGNNKALYSVNTENLEIKKILNNCNRILYSDVDYIYYFEDYDNYNIKRCDFDGNVEDVSSLDMSLKNNSEIGVYNFTCIGKYNNHLYFVGTVTEGTLHIPTSTELFILDCNSKSVTYYFIGAIVKINLKDGYMVIAEQNYETAEYMDSCMRIDTQTQNVDSVGLEYFSEDNLIYDSYGNIIKEKYSSVISLNLDEQVKLKEKYNIIDEDANDIYKSYRITQDDFQIVNDNIFYFQNIEKYSEENSIGWREGYTRDVTEYYMFNLNTKEKTLLYSVVFNNESNELDIKSNDNALKDDEMYLKVDLSNKGTRETFEVRVEEEGNGILGKKVEYEGTHSREEKRIEVKIKKVIGAIVNVYIDNKLDSQIIISE